jgi:hypothetical protein
MLQGSLQDTLRRVQEQKEVHEGFASKAAATLRELKAVEETNKVQSLLAGMPCKLLRAQSFTDAARTQHQLVWDIGAGVRATCTCESAHAKGVDRQPATMELSFDRQDCQGASCLHALHQLGVVGSSCCASAVVKICMFPEIRSDTCCA